MCDLTHTLKCKEYVLNVSKAGGAAGDALRSRQYHIPAEYIEEIDGSKYLCITRKAVCVRRQELLHDLRRVTLVTPDCNALDCCLVQAKTAFPAEWEAR